MTVHISDIDVISKLVRRRDALLAIRGMKNLFYVEVHHHRLDTEADVVGGLGVPDLIRDEVEAMTTRLEEQLHEVIDARVACVESALGRLGVDLSVRV